MGGMTEAQAEHIAQRARAEGEYGEITVHHREGYGYSVTGRKVVNGQGIGRTWGYDDILLERATCGHPPSRYYGYVAADGTVVMGCCDCGAVLTGAAEDETPAGGVPAGQSPQAWGDGRGDMGSTSVVLGTEVDGTITGGVVDQGWSEDMAATIYAKVHGDTDSKGHRAAKIAEIADWLRDGDLKPGELVDDEQLAREWAEYDVEDDDA
jgi:hypothetical protein